MDLQCATREEKIEFYISHRKGECKKFDIIEFDDAVFFRHPDGSYTDQPVPDSELEDLRFDSIFDIKESARLEGVRVRDLTLPNLALLNRKEKEGTDQDETMEDGPIPR